MDHWMIRSDIGWSVVLLLLLPYSMDHANMRRRPKWSEGSMTWLVNVWMGMAVVVINWPNPAQCLQLDGGRSNNNSHCVRQVAPAQQYFSLIVFQLQPPAPTCRMQWLAKLAENFQTVRRKGLHWLYDHEGRIRKTYCKRQSTMRSSFYS